MKKKKVAEHIEASLQWYEPPSPDHYLEVDFLRQHQLAEWYVDYLLLLHEQLEHEKLRRDGEVWYWGIEGSLWPTREELPQWHWYPPGRVILVHRYPGWQLPTQFLFLPYHQKNNMCLE